MSDYRLLDSTEMTRYEAELNDPDHYDTWTSIVEAWGQEHGLIHSEQQLSDKFDEMVQTQQEIDVSDAPLMQELFLDWTLGLTDEGLLHVDQFCDYEYVGKHESVNRVTL